MAESLYKKFETEVDEHTKVLFKQLHDQQLTDSTSFLYSLNNIWKDYCEQMVRDIYIYRNDCHVLTSPAAVDSLDIFVLGSQIRTVRLAELQHDWRPFSMVRI